MARRFLKKGLAKTESGDNSGVYPDLPNSLSPIPVDEKTMQGKGKATYPHNPHYYYDDYYNYLLL